MIEVTARYMHQRDYYPVEYGYELSLCINDIRLTMSQYLEENESFSIDDNTVTRVSDDTMYKVELTNDKKVTLCINNSHREDNVEYYIVKAHVSTPDKNTRLSITGSIKELLSFLKCSEWIRKMLPGEELDPTYYLLPITKISYFDKEINYPNYTAIFINSTNDY